MEQLPRGSNQANCLIFHPLILSFSRREKERSEYTAVADFHVQPLATVPNDIFIHGLATVSVNVYGTAVSLTL